MLSFALESGINFYDLVTGNLDVYKIFGELVAGRRDKIYTQMHFGAAYEDKNYGFSRDLELIKRSFDKVLTAAKMSYSDMGYIHCVDEEDDFESIMNGGLWAHVREMKRQGVIHHIGFSTHTPSIANRFLDTGEIDMFMFSINPAYDYAKGEYGIGAAAERVALYQRAQQLGVGISVMKAFAGGQLLNAAQSPLGIALSSEQCIQYALDRPAVLTCLSGVEQMRDVESLLAFNNASAAARDYSVLSSVSPREMQGRCVYCNHCQPCPQGIDIGLINKYYDLAKAGDELAKSHYLKLGVHAQDCAACGHCEKQCPFKVAQVSRMKDIQNYFGV